MNTCVSSFFVEILGDWLVVDCWHGHPLIRHIALDWVVRWEKARSFGNNPRYTLYGFKWLKKNFVRKVLLSCKCLPSSLRARAYRDHCSFVLYPRVDMWIIASFSFWRLLQKHQRRSPCDKRGTKNNCVLNVLTCVTLEGWCWSRVFKVSILGDIVMSYGVSSQFIHLSLA